MHIIPDLGPSLALSIPFFVAFLGLWFILWKPLMQFLDEREAATIGAREEALAFESEADVRAGQLEQKLAEAHASNVEFHNAARARALAKEAEIVGAARSKAEAHLSEALGRISDEKAKAKAELDVIARSLSTDIVETLLA